MNSWLQDFRYAVRMLGRNVVLTLVIVASLAVGIGANSAIFSVVDALLLRPLPYPQPDRLAAIWLHSPAIGIFQDWPSPGQYIDLQNENHSFQQMALAQSRTFTLTGREQPERVDVLSTQSSLLTMLSAKAMFGRIFLPEEDTPGKPPTAILSNSVWRRLFNSDPNIVGKSVTLDGKPYWVVGVLQRDFMLNAEVMPSEGPMDKVDIFLPLPLGPDAAQRRGDENYNIVVRLKPGVPCNKRKPISTSSPAASARKTSAAAASECISSASGTNRRRRAASTARAHGICRARFADCLCQYRQSSAGARHGA